MKNLQKGSVTVSVIVVLIIIILGMVGYLYFKNTSVQTEQVSVGTSSSVISPNGGETYKPGQDVKITWNVDSNYPAIEVMIVAGKAADGQYTNNGSGQSLRGYVVYKGANTGSFDWIVSTVYPDAGNYFIRIEPFATGGQASGQVGYSDSYFTITDCVAGQIINGVCYGSNDSGQPAQTPPTTTQPDILYVDKVNGYQLELPSDWTGYRVIDGNLGNIPSWSFQLPTTDSTWYETNASGSNVYGYGAVFTVLGYSLIEWNKMREDCNSNWGIGCFTDSDILGTTTTIVFAVIFPSSGPDVGGDAKWGSLAKEMIPNPTSNDYLKSRFSIIQANPTVVITYPQAGDILRDNGNAPIAVVQWKEMNADYPVSIYLLNKNNQLMGSLSAIQIANTGSYVWAHDPYLPNGTYEVVMAINGTINYIPNSSDAYSGYFTVVNSPQQQNPGSPLMEGSKSGM